MTQPNEALNPTLNERFKRTIVGGAGSLENYDERGDRWHSGRHWWNPRWLLLMVGFAVTAREVEV